MRAKRLKAITGAGPRYSYPPQSLKASVVPPVTAAGLARLNKLLSIAKRRLGADRAGILAEIDSWVDVPADAAARLASTLTPEEWGAALTPGLADIMLAGAEASSLFGVGLTQTDGTALSWSLDEVIGSSALSQRVDKLTGEIDKTTTDLIQQAVDHARVDAAGGPIDREALASAIKDIMGDAATDARAMTIATTESVGAANAGAAEFAQMAVDAGFAVTKTWHHWGTDEKQPREDHLAADGESIAFEDEFSTGLMYPHDPAGDAESVINCQCAADYQLAPGAPSDLSDAAAEESDESSGEMSRGYTPGYFTKARARA